MEARREVVSSHLDKAGLLKGVLLNRLMEAGSIEEIDDIWEPFKVKRKTRATAARDHGLQAFGDLIGDLGRGDRGSPWHAAKAHLNHKAGITSSELALQGAMDIVAEEAMSHPEVKRLGRELLKRGASLKSKLKNDGDPGGRFRNYWDFHKDLSHVKPHQFLAIQRGEAEKAITVSITLDDRSTERFLNQILKRYPLSKNQQAPAWKSEWWIPLQDALKDGLKRLLSPSLQREWKRGLKETAEDESYDTYRLNLKNKLLTPPIHCWGGVSNPSIDVTVIGIDPGYRTGCKIAVVDARGAFLESTSMFPHPPQKAPRATEELSRLIRKYLKTDVKGSAVYLSIGNGTASRETEDWARRALSQASSSVKLDLKSNDKSPLGLEPLGYVITDESGASIYSASELATAEFPDMDVTIRGAVSIARRLQDPLAELVKVDPESLGVGLYQHDVNKKRLAEELRGVVEVCVNAVGVDANTASKPLLEHIAGLSTRTSKALIEHREKSGSFKSRAELHKVKGLGQKSFEQAAGFLRVHGGGEPLDATSIHPESYDVAKGLLKRHSIAELKEALKSEVKLIGLGEELSLGVESTKDLVQELTRGREDPRATFTRPILKLVSGDGKVIVADEKGRKGIDAQQAGVTVSDLKPGLVLRGTVRNVVAFGAFVDIGVQHDGLLHASMYPPLHKLPYQPWPRVNDRIDVEVAKIDRDKNSNKVKIGLALPRDAK